MMVEVDQQEILIVDDEESLRKLLSWQFEASGYRVRSAGSGAKALDCLNERRPDVVVLDLRLPDMHGYEVCRALRRLYPRWSTPVLMLTALAEPIDQLRGFAFGADAYLTKPVDFSELLRTVKLLLGEKVLESDIP